MACPLPPNQVEALKQFIGLCKRDPSILQAKELSFFTSYIESLGGVIPRDTKKESKGEKESAEGKAFVEEVMEEESEESEVELDYTGVIDPDNDAPQTMGSTAKEVSEEDMEKSNEKKRTAVDYYAQGKYEDAINAYTDAILLNPRSALLYAKRGQCFLQLQKPNACIRDCTQALEINPDNAAAFKFRGRAHRLLGNFLAAADDLRMACKIDFDEQADEWLKEVTPNARKLEDHQRKYDRKKLEKQLKQTRDRIKKMREGGQQQSRSAEADKPADTANFMDFFKDPEVMTAFQDPDVVEALTEASKNPANLFKYMDNPKVSALLKTFSSKMGGNLPDGLKEMAAGLNGFTRAGAGGGVPPFGGSDGSGQGQAQPNQAKMASEDLD